MEEGSVNKFTFVLVFSIFISACGGGSNNNQTPAEANPTPSEKTSSKKDTPTTTPLSEQSLKDIAEATYYGLAKGYELKQNYSIISRSTNVPFLQSIRTQRQLKKLLQPASDTNPSTTSGSQIDVECSNGGTASISPVEQVEPVSRTIRFSQCDSQGYKINGEVKLSAFSQYEALKIEAKGLTVKFVDSVIELNNASYLCRYHFSIREDKVISCQDYNASFRSNNRHHYELKNIKVLEDDIGHVVSGRIKDDETREIVVIGNSVNFNCNENYPVDGSIDFVTDKSETGRIAFTGCGQYVITYQGVSYNAEIGITP